MKKCNKCQAEMPDEASFCPSCGAEQEAEADTQAEAAAAEAAEETGPEAAQDAAPEPSEPSAQETPAEAAQQKNNRGVLVGIIAAVLVVAVILVTVLLPRNESASNPDVPEDGAASTDGETGDEAGDAPAGDADASTAHHINAYGYPSYSIHFETAEDGSSVFYYLDENGQTVTLEEAEVFALADQVVATCGELELTNRDLMYYYDQQIYTFYNAYSYYIYYFMDTSLGLDEQINLDGSQTWQASFLDAALNAFQQIAALYQDAMASGFTLDEETQATLDNLEADLTEFAAQYGFADAQAYLENYFGPTATVESYLEYIRIGQIATSYADALAQAVELSDEELSNYYDENEETIVSGYNATKTDKNVIDIRHILIAPEDTESEDSWAAAEAEAQRIYEEWQAGEATEDSFAELANTYSTDPGSNTNGGLYEEVYPGQMVDAFNDWCFEDGRAVGDTGIVKSDFGYHIMFFSGEGDYIYWRTLAESLYRSDLSAQQRTEIAANYDYAAELSAAVLMDSVVPSVPAVEEAPVEDSAPAEDGAPAETDPTAESEEDSAD